MYLPEGSAIQSITDKVDDAPVAERPMAERMEMGKILYEANCAACHQQDGTGLAGAFPPLANSDYLMAREDKGAGIIINGLSGKITVNGKEYDGVMPQMQLTDDEIANILTYVRNSWGNKGDLVQASEVKAAR